MNPESAVLGGVVFSRDGVGLEGAGQYYWTDGAEIQRILVRFGPSSAHPIIQCSLGAALSVIGLLPLRLVIDWLRQGGIIWDVQVAAFGLFPLGVWLFRGSFRHSYHLLVQSVAGQKRLPFHHRTSRKDIENFLLAVTDLGFSVEWE